MSRRKGNKIGEWGGHPPVFSLWYVLLAVAIVIWMSVVYR